MSTTAPSTPHRGHFWPASGGGWAAVAASLVGLGSWVVLPVITVNLRETYPVTDTWVMPAIGLALVLIAAVVDLVCLFVWRQRSVALWLLAALTVPFAAFATLMVVGEGLAGI